jgi:hypothetical protein
MPGNTNNDVNGGRVLFGVLIYDGVEAIDLATFGVLSMARRIRSDTEICTIAPRSGVTALANGLRVLADHDFQTAPRLDIIEYQRAWTANTAQFPPLLSP